MRLTAMCALSIVLAGGILSGAPEPPVSRQLPSDKDSCNQPMPDPVTHFKVVDPTPYFSGIVSHDGCWIFLFERRNRTVGNRLAILSRNKGVVEQVRLIDVGGDQDAGGLALTRDDKTLIISGGPTRFLDVGRLLSGQGNPVLASLEKTDHESGGLRQTSLTLDDRFLFRPHRMLAWVSIVDVGKAKGGAGEAAIVGGFPVGSSPINLVLSSDENYLFTTAGADDPTEREGEFIVADIRRARSGGASSVVSKVPAGRDPVWLTLSPDGDTAYVVARLDGLLLAFDLRAVRGGQPPTLIGKVPVGPLPTHVDVIEGGKKLVVANSTNARAGVQPEQTLTVVDVAQIPNGTKAVLGTIQTGADPRHMFLTPDGRTLMVTNLVTRTLQIIDLERVKLDPPNPQPR